MEDRVEGGRWGCGEREGGGGTGDSELRIYTFIHAYCISFDIQNAIYHSECTYSIIYP